jgi:hypothetical protein
MATILKNYYPNISFGAIMHFGLYARITSSMPPEGFEIDLIASRNT